MLTKWPDPTPNASIAFHWPVMPALHNKPVEITAKGLASHAERVDSLPAPSCAKV